MREVMKPKAPGDREKVARELFPFREMTPEEYADIDAGEWEAFSFDDFSYSDPVLDDWIARLGKALRAR